MSAIFDSEFYLRENPDVAAAVQAGTYTSAEEHFRLEGQFENRAPSAFFDPQAYLAANPDVAAAVQSGLIQSAFSHFIEFGTEESRDPGPFFDTDYYLAINPDVAAAVERGETTAFDHFSQFGLNETRDVSPFFDIEGYLAANPDIAVAVAAGATTAYQHFIQFGYAEGRDLGNGVDLSFFANDPTSQAAIASGDFTALFARVAEVAPFLPTFVPPAGYTIPADQPLPTDFVPPQGQFLVIPDGVNPPSELPPGFEQPVDPGPGPNPQPPAGQTLTLTLDADTLTGGAGNDRFVAAPAEDEEGGSVNTLQTGDTLDGGAGTDTLTASLTTGFPSGTAAPTLRNIETVEISVSSEGSSGVFDLNLSNALGIQQLTVRDSSANATISNIGDVSRFAILNDESGQDVTFSGSTSTSVRLDVVGYGGTFEGDVTFVSDTAVSTLELTSTNSRFSLEMNPQVLPPEEDPDFLLAEEGGNDLTDLTLAVTGDNTITFGGLAAVESVEVTGTGSVDLSGAAFGNALETFDASGNTGGVVADLSGRGFEPSKLSVTGGSGDDRFVFGVLDGGVQLDADAGFDTVAIQQGSFNDGESAVALNALDGVERLEFYGANSCSGTSIDLAVVTNPGFETFLFNTQGSDRIQNVAEDQTIEFGADNGSGAQIELANGAEVLNLAYLGDASTSNLQVAAGSGEPVRLAIDSTVSLEDGNSTGTIFIRSGSTIELTGDGDLSIFGISDIDDGATGGFTVDASALTGDLELLASSGGDDVTLGEGQTMIRFERGGSGDLGEVDIEGIDVVRNFDAGADGDVLSTFGGFGGGYVALSSGRQEDIDAADSLVEAFAIAADARDTAGWTAFSFEDKTYAAYSDGDASFDVDDLLVELTGVAVADLTEANFEFGGLILAP